MEVYPMYSMTSLPRKVHFSAVFQMFSFLNSKHNGVAVFNPTKPEIDTTQFPTAHWSVTPYGTCKEDVPSNAPTLRCT